MFGSFGVLPVLESLECDREMRNGVCNSENEDLKIYKLPFPDAVKDCYLSGLHSSKRRKVYS